MSETIKLLAAAVPNWATINRLSQSSLEISTAGKHLSGQPLRQYQVSIEVNKGWHNGVFAREHYAQRLLPDNCLMRHMNTDGTFCIGLDAPWSVTNSQSAGKWWELLLGYLRCQDVAHLARRWPPNRGLSHGDAAEIQLEAEAVAERLGLLVEYREHVEHGAPWPPARMDQSPELFELLQLEKRRREADERFGACIAYTCCQTMDGCPLNRNIQAGES
ncbi:E2 domain-containing protein [Devosia sp. XK-2]|uniref:E2 domain-containing protein n=1 Tax=Devosia sp. XK-2 TaxID=3126689 RepID=UPI0030CB53D9